MTKITTAHCKQFIADFHKANPQIETARFTTPHNPIDAETRQIILATTEPKNWKRISKNKPDPDEKYHAYIDGAAVNRYAEPQEYIPSELIACERGFDLELADGQVAYRVLELKDGTLRLGDYIGD